MQSSQKQMLLRAAVGAGVFFAARAVLQRWDAYELRGKTVLITGGSRGLGLLMARECVQEGARVALCARDSDELVRAQANLEATSAQVLAVPCDVTDQKQVQEMIHTVRKQFGQIDVLINNAGIVAVGPLEVMTQEDYEDAMNIHFWAPLYTMLAVLPEMRQRRSGRIVNIASIGGKLSVPHLVPYSASKFALVGLSKGFHAELAKDGIVVTTVCPGLMRTGSHEHAIFKGQHRAEYAWFSIGGAFPLNSISGEHAARQIIAACKRGEAEVVLSLPAQIADTVHALLPSLTTDLLGVVNRLLPAPGGIGSAHALGKDSHSALAPSWVTTLNEQAAQRNNEVA